MRGCQIFEMMRSVGHQRWAGEILLTSWTEGKGTIRFVPTNLRVGPAVARNHRFSAAQPPTVKPFRATAEPTRRVVAAKRSAQLSILMSRALVRVPYRGSPLASLRRLDSVIESYTRLVSKISDYSSPSVLFLAKRSLGFYRNFMNGVLWVWYLKTRVKLVPSKSHQSHLYPTLQNTSRCRSVKSKRKGSRGYVDNLQLECLRRKKGDKKGRADEHNTQLNLKTVAWAKMNLSPTIEITRFHECAGISTWLALASTLRGRRKTCLCRPGNGSTMKNMYVR